MASANEGFAADLTRLAADSSADENECIYDDMEVHRRELTVVVREYSESPDRADNEGKSKKIAQFLKAEEEVYDRTLHIVKMSPTDFNVDRQGEEVRLQESVDKLLATARDLGVTKDQYRQIITFSEAVKALKTYKTHEGRRQNAVKAEETMQAFALYIKSKSYYEAYRLLSPAAMRKVPFTNWVGTYGNSRYGYLTKLQSRPDGKDAVILTYAIGPDKGEGKKDITVRLVQVDTKWLIDSIDEE
ncbi:MAG: hypothetical protein HXM56_06980 [Megasphaera micronuciformis]|nr:hypothetical protein [Megasphaera micronuciformis]